MKKAKKTRVIPGYHLTFGIVITLLSLIVLIPLASVLVYALKLSPGEWFRLSLPLQLRADQRGDRRKPQHDQHVRQRKHPHQAGAAEGS